MRPARMLMRNAVLAALLLVLPGAAGATLLSALEGTSQSIGPLTFDFTKVEIAGPLDPTQIDLTLVSDGLGIGFDVTPVIAGALSVANGGLADVKLEFTITAAVGVVEAGNQIAGSVSGLGSSASVSELIEEAPAVDLGVFLSSFGSLTDNFQSLGATLFTLTITKNIVLSADDAGSATVDRLSQRFLVPEPTTAVLMLLGISGLGWAGRRR